MRTWNYALLAMFSFGWGCSYTEDVLNVSVDSVASRILDSAGSESSPPEAAANDDRTLVLQKRFVDDLKDCLAKSEEEKDFDPLDLTSSIGFGTVAGGTLAAIAAEWASTTLAIASGAGALFSSALAIGTNELSKGWLTPTPQELIESCMSDKKYEMDSSDSSVLEYLPLNYITKAPGDILPDSIPDSVEAAE